MTSYQQIPFSFLLLLLFFCADKILATNYGTDKGLYVIRSTGSGGQLALDGIEPPHVKLQYFSGFSSQLWQFKCGSKVGLYYIINNHTGNALDVLRKPEDAYLVMSKQKDTLRQQWSLNSNGRIANMAASLNIDIQRADYSAGKSLILINDNGNKAQEFHLQLLGALEPDLDPCKYLLR